MAAGQSAMQQLLAALPKCAAACAQSILPSSTCSLTDIACLCADAPILGRIEQCSTANCTVIEALSAFNATQTACGVTPRDMSHTYIVVVSIFLALAVLFYLIRLSVRPPLTPGFRVDDGIMLVATLTVVVFTALNLQAARLGLGKDIWNVVPDDIDIVLKNFFIGEFLYIFISVVTKLAVLAFYLKVFTQPYFQKTAYVVMGLCFSYFVSYMFVLGFECTPVSFFWEQWRDPSAGKCIDINAGGWAAAGINIILDVAILAMPVPVILRLDISRQQKLQVLSMFGVGSLITVVSIIRLQSLIKFAKDSNVTYHLYSVSIWSSLELYISIVCACMPATRLFLQKCWPSRFGTSKEHARSYLRQSSASHDGGRSHHQQASPPPPTRPPFQPILSVHPTDRMYMSKPDVNVNQFEPGRHGDMELTDSDGWMAASRGGRAYMSTNHAGRY
ncbi:hypothetical protein PV08_03237 [Exophiala spinifera]|uniref:CFEM domain-containing protein n=1 Tax=Exophiala spinifera TaxID=91928 RepID=A0A0D2BJ68_9EURO|nr:uncharacterized protein PV08_03237 [Exophiala spinifera]KIW18948.1 hypothetical protein PV08_03237 [Exophiala spinifera]